MAEVCVIIGSKSDQELADEAVEVLKEHKVDYELHIASAHREPDRLDMLVKGSDADVFLAIAGLSAALPGVIASKTQKPVIGVPRDVKLEGLDALLSMLQMPPGVPVAVVGIDNAKNGALLAIRILGLKE